MFHRRHPARAAVGTSHRRHPAGKVAGASYRRHPAGKMPPMATAFDLDTALDEAGPDRFTAQLSDRWSVGPALNGGYGLAVGVRALARMLPHPDPLTVTGHYLRTLAPGPAEVRGELVKAGRTVSNGQAAIVQDGRERLRVVAAFGQLVDDPRPRLVDGAPPELPPLPLSEQGAFGAASRLEGGASGAASHPELTVVDRFVYRFALDHVHHRGGPPTGEAVTRAWARFADGRDFDLLGLACVVDVLPPAVAELGIDGWVPTIELTVHLRAQPVPGWVRVLARTRFIQGGLFQEDAEVWDDDGRLVAQSRQLARLPG